jgi:hypothetical protein
MSNTSLRRKAKRLKRKIRTRKRKLGRTALNRAIHAVNLALHRWFPWITIQDEELRQLVEKHDHIKQKLQDVEDSYSRNRRKKHSRQSADPALVAIAGLAVCMLIGYSFDGFEQVTEATPVPNLPKAASAERKKNLVKPKDISPAKGKNSPSKYFSPAPNTIRDKSSNALFEIIPVPGDGCCFYHSVQKSAPTYTVPQLRNFAADYIDTHRGEFSAGGTSKAVLDKIIRKIRTKAEMAEGPAIHAMQKALNRQIIVLDTNGNRIRTVTCNDVRRQNPIFVLYHGYTPPYFLHYEALRKL